MTSPPASSGACAAAFPAHHWPAALSIEKFVGNVYHCLVYEIESEGFTAFCADFCGMYGDGPDVEAALADLRCKAECRVGQGGGGVYAVTSGPLHQERAVAGLGLERMWAEDGVVVLGRRRARLTLFGSSAFDTSRK